MMLDVKASDVSKARNEDGDGSLKSNSVVREAQKNGLDYGYCRGSASHPPPPFPSESIKSQRDNDPTIDPSIFERPNPPNPPEKIQEKIKKPKPQPST